MVVVVDGGVAVVAVAVAVGGVGPLMLTEWELVE